MKAKKDTTYSLHFTTSSLFITLILVFAGILSWQNYNNTSAILIASGDQVFDQINTQIALEYSAIRKSVKQTINFVAQSSIDHIDSLLEPRSLRLLSSALINDTNLSAIQIGYSDGNYFIIRPIKSDYIQNTFAAPDGSSYVIDIINADAQEKRTLSRLFYDDALNEVARNSSIATNYDPRQRPWYKLALEYDEPATTQPYLFHFIGKIGVTLTTRTAYEGIVVAADVTLDQLSSTLANQNTTPGSQTVVFQKNGTALIYTDINRLLIKTSDGQFRIAKLSELGSEVLAFLSQDFRLKTQSLNFNFKGETWLGGIREMQITEGSSFFVLMVSPEKELLSSAIKIREQSLIITAIIILLTIPIVWLFARKISSPLHRLATATQLISSFDFSKPVKTHSMITEVEELATAMRMMKSTISQFLSLIHSLSGEQNFDILLQRITQQTMQISEADGAVTYLYNEKENTLEPRFMHVGTEDIANLDDINTIFLDAENELGNCLDKTESSFIELSSAQPSRLNTLLDKLASNTATMITLPLRNRQEDRIGLLCLLYKEQTHQRHNTTHISFVQALSGFAAVSIESRQMLMLQKALLESFIKLIAGAIDSKSPYTGGHCARVPEITRLITEAACASNDAPFQNFQLNEEQWESLHIASWLHDCGKVTTPEYVVDKATKLETIYDRIHEIRMRVEVLKRDAEIRYWQQVAEGGDANTLRARLDNELHKLDQDYAFIAECNEGSEFMAPEKMDRLAEIANYTWLRTLDDTIGISWEENQRKQKAPRKALPVTEKLLADKVEHIIERAKNDKMPADNPWGFRLDVPEHKYNRGELYNLCIERGTLTAEERFKINDHIVQTIIMLENLPYPKHLREVPAIAGSHHEKMDGTGYPKRLNSDDMPMTAKIVAVADIFEALTASDRPYKKAKSLSEAIQIMSFMVKDKHIDPDIFRLFLNSGVYMQYAEKFLAAEQIDWVDISQFVNL